MTLEWSQDLPEAEEYCALRAATGLGPRDVEAAQRGLPQTIFAVTLRDQGRLIGMGRVIGDAGCFVQFVDIAVLPDFQGQRLGGQIMERLMARCRAELPKTCFVSLITYDQKVPFYARYGFQDEVGMGMTL